jgi:hypothetical protein
VFSYEAAFSLFNLKRKMTHALYEAIPGSPQFSDEDNIAYAFERFKKSMIDFLKLRWCSSRAFRIWAVIKIGI